MTKQPGLTKSTMNNTGDVNITDSSLSTSAATTTSVKMKPTFLVSVGDDDTLCCPFPQSLPHQKRQMHRPIPPTRLNSDRTHTVSKSSKNVLLPNDRRGLSVHDSDLCRDVNDDSIGEEILGRGRTSFGTENIDSHNDDYEQIRHIALMVTAQFLMRKLIDLAYRTWNNVFNRTSAADENDVGVIVWDPTSPFAQVVSHGGTGATAAPIDPTTLAEMAVQACTHAAKAVVAGNSAASYAAAVSTSALWGLTSGDERLRSEIENRRVIKILVAT
jgi:hypothetical protein